MNAQIFLAGVAIILLAFACQRTNAEYNVATYCQFVPIGTQFPSFKSCQTYYVCQTNYQAVAYSCPGTDVFNKDTQSCVSASSLNCYYDIDNPCEGKDGTWVPDSKVCTMWHYCSNGAITGSGTCENGQYFDGVIGICRNGICPNSGGTTQITNLCQIMQTEQFFGDPDNCATWHKCSGPNMNTGKCESPLIYNTEQRMCLPSNGDMCAGPAEECNQGASGQQIANPKVCSVFFECTQSNSNWLWKKNQCPIGQYYDLNTKNCLYREAATPIQGCNRCEFTTATWVNAVDSNCKNFQTCDKGQVIGNGSCPAADGFFNEQGQVCMNNNQDLPQYRQTNGACSSQSVVATTTIAPTTNPTEEPTTEAPGDNETTTEKPGDNETTTEAPSDNGTTTEAPSDNETTTEAPSDNETTTEVPEN